MAYTAGRKIVKAPGESLDKFEDSVNQVRMRVWGDGAFGEGEGWGDSGVRVCVVQALLELEANPDIKSTLREVYFSSAKAS